MKKFLSLAMLSLSVLIFVPSIEANTNNAPALTANSAAPQTLVQIRRGNNRRNNARTVRTYTRNVRRGRVIFRETYRVVSRPNGTTKTQLVSRIRVNRY